MLALSMIERNWSAAVALKKMPETTVEATKPTRVFVSGMTRLTMLASIPLAFSTPPKQMAQRIIHTVLSIPAMPRVASNSLTGVKPLSIAVDLKQLVMAPLNKTMAEDNVPGIALASMPLTSAKICGWKMTAKTMAITEEAKSTMMAGIFLYIIHPVAIGTSKSQRLRLNVEDKAEVKADVSIEAVAGTRKPAVRKMINVMVKEGTVVIIMYLICVNNGVPQSEEARTVVSDNGDILSPK